MENHNNECLHREHSKENPVAIIISLITTSSGRQAGHTKYFQRNNIPALTQVCIGAKVQLKGKNIRPSKGLYNGSFEGKNPGLLYTIEGRASALGNPRNKMSSALYFTGEDMKADRILNITKGANGKLF
jgi:hypothetical protein